ncbi:hypothetical protein D3C76_1741110 [compost metagenome]
MDGYRHCVACVDCGRQAGENSGEMGYYSAYCSGHIRLWGQLQGYTDQYQGCGGGECGRGFDGRGEGSGSQSHPQ